MILIYRSYMLAALLLVGFPLTLAHEHNDNEKACMGMLNVAGPGSVSTSSNVTGADKTSTVLAPPSYFVYADYSNLLLVHIVFMTIAWVFILPIHVMFSITRSRLTLPTQLVFLLVNALGLVLGKVYNDLTPNLYQNNAHHKLGWILTWVTLVQGAVRMLEAYTGRRKNLDDPAKDLGEEEAFLLSNEAMAQQLTSHELLITGRDRHESSRTSESVHPRGNSISSLHDFDEDETLATGTPPNFEREARYLEKQGLRRHHAFERLLFKVISSKVSERMVKCLSIVYYSIDRSILILGFIALSTGIVTYGGTFRGQNVFNGLAHFIKGGIFFWYGLLVLGRYTGSFSDLGWSWNVKPSAGLVGSLKANTPSAEFFESFIIFFYGSTNMFLEHLASWGGPWSAQDLEHESISIMFFGGGLCGMLIESKQIRDFLNAALFPSHAHNSPLSQDSFQQPQTYGFSMNPVPGLIILLLGFMMSSHHQASLVSSMVHKQWGTLFVGAALARGVTYILTYISPPTSVLPSRPPSELIVAFCLISGGLIFMASNKDMVDGMEFYKLNAMFVFTVVMGLTAFLMAWEIVVLAIKGWAVKREHKPWNGQHNPISKTVYRAMGLP